MMDKYRVLNHENKNQLLLIKSMINNKDKKVTNYIDEIILFFSEYLKPANIRLTKINKIIIMFYITYHFLICLEIY